MGSRGNTLIGLPRKAKGTVAKGMRNTFCGWFESNLPSKNNKREIHRMKIVRMLDQYRRDFWADFECEGCGYMEHDRRGYDDRNFHDNVIPNMKCKRGNNCVCNDKKRVY